MSGSVVKKRKSMDYSVTDLSDTKWAEPVKPSLPEKEDARKRKNLEHDKLEVAVGNPLKAFANDLSIVGFKYVVDGASKPLRRTFWGLLVAAGKYQLEIIAIQVL